MRQPEFSPRLQSHLFGRIFPLLVGVSAVAMAISCAKDNGTNVNKTGAGTAAATQAEASKLFSYDSSAPENIKLSDRVEGITVTAQPSSQATAGQSANPGNDQSQATAGVAPAPSATPGVASYDIQVKILVDDTDPAKPAFTVSGKGTVRGKDTSNAATAADGIVPVSVAVPAIAASTDPTTAPSVTDPSGASAAKPGLLTLQPNESSPEVFVNGRFSLFAKCSDARCTHIVVRLGEKVPTTASTANAPGQTPDGSFIGSRVVFAYSSPTGSTSDPLKLIWSGQKSNAPVATATPINGSRAPVAPAVQSTKRKLYDQARTDRLAAGKPISEPGSAVADGSAPTTSGATGPSGASSPSGATGPSGAAGPTGSTVNGVVSDATIPSGVTESVSQEMAGKAVLGAVGATGIVIPTAAMARPTTNQ